MSSIPLRRTLDLVRAAGLESAALAGQLLLYPTGLAPGPWPLPAPTCDHPPRRSRRPGTAPPGHAPVLLLHGLFENQAVFTLLRRSLRSHGWEHVHALDYSPLTADVHGAAVRFGRQVVSTRQLYGGERIAVVGHSLGGLIARYYVQHLGGSEHVHTVATLGTPHSGTPTALLLHPLPLARQLLPGSRTLRTLSAPAPGCDTRFLCFWGDCDPLVLPRDSARLHHPDLLVENIRVAGAGHVSLLVHPRVLALLRQRLSAPPAPAVRPGPTDRLSA